MIIFTLLLGALLSVIGVVSMPWVADFLGATEEMMADCILYGRIVTGFTVAFMLQNVFQSFLIAAEKPKLGLLATVMAGVTNMALDAIFIIVFKWGVAGAAIATGLSQCVGGIFPLIYFSRKNSSLLCLTKTKLETVGDDDTIYLLVKLLEEKLKTGKIGDGKLFIEDVEDVIRIRTGEHGEIAL